MIDCYLFLSLPPRCQKCIGYSTSKFFSCIVAYDVIIVFSMNRGTTPRRAEAERVSKGQGSCPAGPRARGRQRRIAGNRSAVNMVNGGARSNRRCLRFYDGLGSAGGQQSRIVDSDIAISVRLCRTWRYRIASHGNLSSTILLSKLYVPKKRTPQQHSE